MPFKQSRGGYRVSRKYGCIAGIDVPVINRAIGTTDYETALAVEKAMDALTELGKHGAVLLHDIATGQRRPIDVYHVWNQQTVREVKAIVSAEPLDVAWSRFVKTARRKNGKQLGDRTKRDYENYLKRLKEVDPKVTIRTLPAVLAAYRVKCVDAGQNASFMKVRAACLSFARNTQTEKQWSVLWAEIAKVGITDTTSKKQDTALPVYEVAEIIAKLPQPRLRHIAWALATTGMRIGEYAGSWEVLDDRIVIRGTKSGAAERVVPMPVEITPEPFSMYVAGVGMVRNGVKPGTEPLTDKAFRIALAKASDNRVTPHTLRHCFRLWLDEAGIPDLRSNTYMGHAQAGLKERYARHKQDLKLIEDTETLVAYLDKNMKRPEASIKQVRRLRLG